MTRSVFLIRLSIQLQLISLFRSHFRFGAVLLHLALSTSLLGLISICFLQQAGAQQTISINLSTKAGVNWEFKPEGSEWKNAIVPGGGWRAQGYTCDAGAYRAFISVPASSKGKIARIAFAAVNFGAEVSVGKDAEHLTRVASHINGWVPFTADITPYVKPGQKLMVQVEVKGRRKFMVNGKYTVPEGATWCPTLEEGILRGITLQMLPDVHIDDVFVRTRLSPDTVQALVTVTNNAQKSVNVSLAAHLASWNQAKYLYPKIPTLMVTLKAGETKTIDLGVVGWTAGSPSYWWPNLPYKSGYQAQLHLLDISLNADGKLAHRYEQRFGFRQFVVKGNHYELNGIKCNLRGDNQQEADFGTDAYGVKAGFGPPSSTNPGWPQAVDNLLRLNFNVMRIHQIPATPYMLDVCDEKGLMLVDESPLRGSEGGEDFVNGHDNMLNMDRELVLRDRNHAAIIIWSAANEWADPIREATKAILMLDDTRPVIADGIGDIGADVINMEHYVNGLGGLPVQGGSPRTDRPFGETEAVWDMDNTWQGFAWMATSVRLRRLKGDADLRNYVLNNAWSNYVPGENATTEILEKKVKNMGGNKEIRPALEDPWNHPLIRLMQRCYDPMAVCDIDFDRLNTRSNAAGDWPAFKPRLLTESRVERQIAVFNDEFVGDTITLHWELRQGSKTGVKLDEGTQPLRIPPGEFRTHLIAFAMPKTPGEVCLLLSSTKDEKIRFTEDQIVFAVVTELTPLLPDGDYILTNAHSHLPAAISQADSPANTPIVQQLTTNGTQVWHVTNLGNDDVILTNKKTGLALAVRDASMDDGALIVQQAATKETHQLWHLTDLGGGNYTLTNKASGKLLDDLNQATTPGSVIAQYKGNGGENQQWQIMRAAK